MASPLTVRYGGSARVATGFCLWRGGDSERLRAAATDGESSGRVPGQAGWEGALSRVSGGPPRHRLSAARDWRWCQTVWEAPRHDLRTYEAGAVLLLGGCAGDVRVCVGWWWRLAQTADC